MCTLYFNADVCFPIFIFICYDCIAIRYVYASSENVEGVEYQRGHVKLLVEGRGRVGVRFKKIEEKSISEPYFMCTRNGNHVEKTSNLMMSKSIFWAYNKCFHF